MSRTKRRRTLTRALGPVLLAAMAAVLIVVPSLPTSDPYSQNLAFTVQPALSIDPTGDLHILGTDQLGRDLFSRLALGGRISVLLALAAASLSVVFGSVLGLVAGYFGGRIDVLISTFADIQLSMPRVLLLIAILAALSPTLPTIALALGLTGWVVYGRVVRAETLSIRERDFVLAARAVGVDNSRMLLRHILPNERATILVLASFEFSQVIILEASLSFLGIGIQPPLPAWGTMIGESRDFLRSVPHLMIMPALALFIVVAGANLVTRRFTFEDRAS